MVPSRLISIHGDTNCLGAGVFHALVHVGYLILTYLVHGLSQRKLGPFHVRLGSSTVCVGCRCLRQILQVYGPSLALSLDVNLDSG